MIKTPGPFPKQLKNNIDRWSYDFNIFIKSPSSFHPQTCNSITVCQFEVKSFAITYECAYQSVMLLPHDIIVFKADQKAYMRSNTFQGLCPNIHFLGTPQPR